MIIFLWIVSAVLLILAIAAGVQKRYSIAAWSASLAIVLFVFALCVNDFASSSGIKEEKKQDAPGVKVPDDFLFLVGNVHLSIIDGSYIPEGKNWEDYELINKLYFLHNVADELYFYEAFPDDNNIGAYLKVSGVKKMYDESVEGAKKLLSEHAQGYRDLYVKALKQKGINATSSGTTFTLRDRIITDATFARLRFKHYESDLRLLGFKSAIFKSSTFSYTFNL